MGAPQISKSGFENHMSYARPSKESFPDASFDVRKKIKVYAVLVVISFLVILMRVWYLQILKGEDFMGQSEENRSRKISLPDYRVILKIVVVKLLLIFAHLLVYM